MVTIVMPLLARDCFTRLLRAETTTKEPQKGKEREESPSVTVEQASARHRTAPTLRSATRFSELDSRCWQVSS